MIGLGQLRERHEPSLEGKRLYALRKQIPEPVFGIIKSVMGYRLWESTGGYDGSSL
jgi:hypothetical protein